MSLRRLGIVYLALSLILVLAGIMYALSFYAPGYLSTPLGLITVGVMAIAVDIVIMIAILWFLRRQGVTR